MRISSPLRTIRNVAMAVSLALLLLSVAGPVVSGASPEPTVLVTGDPRSEGQGPGVIGQPLVILLGVVALGAAAAGATLLIVRLTRDD